MRLYKAVDEYLEQGVYNNTLLEWAASTGNVAVLRYLKRQGVSYTKYGRYALCFASQNSQIETSKVLLEDITDKQWINEALYRAVSYSTVECACIFLEAGANPNATLLPPVIEAIRRNDLEMVKLLHQYGANLSVQWGWPLKLAKQKGFTEIAEYIEQNVLVMR